MNVTEKFRLAIAEGEPLHWAILQYELDAEHALAASSLERENLLTLLTIMADMVERIDTTATTIAHFQDERRQIYHRLLLREACPDGRSCAKLLNDVTAREVNMGRMLQDDPMRLAAIADLARMTDGMDVASRGLPVGLAWPVVVADGSDRPWRRWMARMASMARRPGASLRRNPQSRTA